VSLNWARSISRDCAVYVCLLAKFYTDKKQQLYAGGLVHLSSPVRQSSVLRQ